MDKTSFGEEVYSVVASIPPGRVLTYGQIAYLICMQTLLRNML